MELSGYILEPLRKDEEFVLYRGRHPNQPGSPALLLVPATERPTVETLKKLDHEYSLKDELDSAWAVRPLALLQQSEQPTLVLEDAGGEPLHRLIQGPMEIRQFLRIAIGLAAALGQLHKRKLIHKDVKPSNVLVDSATGQVWITGFGIASRLPRERQAAVPHEFISGTLAYMAPEQTGRMNRSIDSRSDLYALGVTLYEMLTGTLPFTVSDPMELMHCHIARQPTPPCDLLNGVPGMVSATIMKLLAKTAEERHQTAVGVEGDLRRCLEEWEAHHRIGEFALCGEHELLIPEKLYGRDHEVEELLASFDRIVKSGAAELVLVSGYSGVGKSSVVHELRKVLAPPRGLFASGKFDQYKRDIPYATLAQAFQSLLRTLLTKSEEELGKWRDTLREALEPNGQLIVDLVPELKLIIGEQPPVAPPPLQDAQRRFQLVFRRFISVFARPEHPLVLFLDDLQWLDAATLDLMEDLLTQSDVKHLLLIGAYRDNEVHSAHPLMRKLEAIRRAGAVVQEIVLAPLGHRDLAQLIADSLHCETERATPLARLVHDKTAGNPFFAIQFIHALAEEGLVSFKHGERQWLWDLDGIHAKGHTDNVVDLMVGKLNRLPEETQNALRQLACLGNSADFAMLRIASQDSIDELHRQFWVAVRAGLIFRSEDSYRFLHDRVQEAAYSLIPQELRAEAHLRLGMLLAAQTPAEKREETIFEIVNQLNRGAALISSQDERDHLAELNLIAGRRAKVSTAYVSALSYLSAGRALLTEKSWDDNYELTFSIEILIAECEFLTGQAAAAEERLTMLSSRARNTVELANVTCLRVDLYTTLDESDRAVAVCLDYLRHLGFEWSPHPTKEEVQQEYDRIWSQLGSREIEDLIELPLMSDSSSLATLDVLTKVLPSAFFTDANLVSLAVCRAVNLSLEHGNADGSCVAFVTLGQVAGPHFGNYKAGFRFGRLGYELVEKCGLKRFQARTYMVFGSHVLPWTKHVRAGRDLIHWTFEVANKIGDLCFAAFSCVNLNANLFAAGDSLAEVQREAENGLEFAHKARFGFAIDNITAQLGLVRTLRGSTPKFGSFDDGQFEELRFERHLASNPALAQPACFYWIRKLQARFLAGDYASALDALLKAQRLLWTAPSNLEIADYHLYGGLCRAASWDSALPEMRQQHFEPLTTHKRELEIWAENCPENFENRAALLGAEIARIEGRDLQAMRLYEQAIRSARANGFVHNEALAIELAARFYAARGFEKIARAYFRDARYYYQHWGADGKVRRLDDSYPHLKEEKPAVAPTSTIGVPIEHLDLGTVIKVSQAVSGEMDLDKLIDKLMRTAIEHAGAARGVLILSRGDEQRIEAEATTSWDKVIVRRKEAALRAVPQSIVNYVTRTQQSVILDDASSQNPFSADAYILEHRARSILCLPLINQTRLIGVLYLENDLTSRVFTPTRIEVLKLLASQAAISLENARLYADLERRGAKIRRLVDANIMGIFIWDLEGKIIEANEAFLHMVQYGREDLVSGHMRWTDLTPGEWRDRDARAIEDLRQKGSVQPYEKEFFRKDGNRVPVLAGGALFEADGAEGVAFVLDLSEQKRAEDAVRQSEQRWQTAFENSAIGITLRDRTGRYVAANSAFQNMLGYRESELCRLTFMDLTYEEDLEANLELIRELLEGKRQHYQIEKRYVRRDGTLLWVRNNVALVAGMGEEEPFLFAVVEDITERKQEEAARRYIEEKHRVVVETATDAVVCADDHGAILFANPATLRVFGYDPAELIGKTLTVLMPEYMRNLHEDGFQRYLATGHRHINWQGTEFTGLRKNGQEFPVEVSFGELVKDGQRLFTGFIRDISERKQAEEALRRSEAYLAESQRLTHTGSWASHGTTHEAKYWSEEMFRVFGFDPQQGLPMRDQWLQRVHPEDRDKVKRQASDRMFFQKLDSDLEFRIVLPDGTVKHIHGLAHPVFSSNRELVEVVGTAIDITERRRAENERERLQQLEADLAHINRVTTMGELTASLAHEIKQPIFAAVTNAETCLQWLESRQPDLAEARQAASRLIKDVTRASEIISRIALLFKKDALPRELVDVNELIREMILLLQGEAARYSISIHADLATGLPQILADRVGFQQVLMNLMLNGIEAMKQIKTPGKLTIKSQQDEHRQLVVAVSDTGVGLPQEHSEQIFNAFFTSKAQGTGMGLAISRSIIESHGGRLWAASNSGPGATFHFTLPLDAKTRDGKAGVAGAS